MIITLLFFGLLAAFTGTGVALSLGQPLWIAGLVWVGAGQVGILLFAGLALLRQERDLHGPDPTTGGREAVAD